MMSEIDVHPTRDTLKSFDSGLLRHEDQQAVEKHVAACEICCKILDDLPQDVLAIRLRRWAGTAIPDETKLNETQCGYAQDAPLELLGHPRYEILSYIGSGGMGNVYKAIQLRMQRIVAIKVLHQRLTNRSGFASQFQEEVKGLARLNHPHVVTAYDADQAGDSHFLVMEFVEGERFDEMVRRRGPLPPAEACELIRQATEGLRDDARTWNGPPGY